MEYRKPSENDEHGFCKHCGRDNRGYEGEACSDDCPFYDSEQGWSGTAYSVKQLGKLRIDNEEGDSYDMLTVLLFPAGTNDLRVSEFVREAFPVWRCQHEHDCCGHFYPYTPRWTRLHPQSNRVIVSQNFAANI